MVNHLMYEKIITGGQIFYLHQKWTIETASVERNQLQIMSNKAHGHMSIIEQGGLL